MKWMNLEECTKAIRPYNLERIDILTKVDRASMANSLEVRPPLLDHRLVEFVLNIPAKMRYQNGEKKYLFK